MTVIFALAFIAAVIISTSLFVVLIGYRRQHKKTEDMLRVFNGMSDEFGLSISKQDAFGDRIIGLDEANRNLLFVTRNDGVHIVDLDDIKTATIKKEYGLVFASYTRQRGARTAAKQIELELTYKNRAASIVLPLYDNDNSDKLKREQAVDMAEKWQKLISGILTKHDGATNKHQQSSRKLYV